MIVPAYWAEGRVRSRSGGRQVTVRRFGWSDESQAAAQRHADQRAQEAFDRVQRGEALPRFEYKRAYNGAEGVPIREEILERHGAAVITRNGYGARCLNVPDVLFADVDIEGGGVGASLRAAFAPLLRLVAPAMARPPEARARERVDAFIAANPTGLWRLYRTPAGFRLLAVHRTYDPASPETQAVFEALATDRIYARMCTRQRCFRARVSPKPWRIGIEKHIGPAHATWPIKPERMPQRQRWIDAYERAARGHAACRFIGEFGGGRADPTALAIVRLHDDACRASQELPLA